MRGSSVRCLTGDRSVGVRGFCLRIVFAAGCAAYASVHAEALGCLIEPDRVAEIGAQSVGVIEKLKVERGDEVRQGQLLARLSADVERASVAVAEARARTEAELHAAIAANELAQSKLARA